MRRETEGWLLEQLSERAGCAGAIQTIVSGAFRSGESAGCGPRDKPGHAWVGWEMLSWPEKLMSGGTLISKGGKAAAESAECEGKTKRLIGVSRRGAR